MHLGILAYGSLIDEPGEEIQPLIISRIACSTPFNVEYARMSKTRDYAPTLVPVKEGGGSVAAVVLVLRDGVTIDDAKSMLWRRETRQKTKSKPYKEPQTKSANAVTVEVINNFVGVTQVLYTSIGNNLSIFLQSPQILATLAINSARSKAGENKMDGVTYLRDAIKNGIRTPLTESYQQSILDATSTTNLDEAISALGELRKKNLEYESRKLEFEAIFRNLADLVCQYGVDMLKKNEPLTFSDFKEKIQANADQFRRDCQTGFKMAQAQIVKLMLDCEAETELLNQRIKGLNRKTDKNEINTIKEVLDFIASKEKVLRHLIDTIAWQMLGGNLHVARRLYQKVKGHKKLSKSNIESVIATAAQLNKDPDQFALITDLSSFIQVGDIMLQKIQGGITYVEVKEGRKNHEMLELMNKVLNSQDSTTVETILNEAKLTKDSALHLNRTINQFYTMHTTANIINNDGGIDKDGKQVKIVTPKEDVPVYAEKLVVLYEELKKNNLFSYDLIDDCLHIGMYKGPLMFLGETILKALAEPESNPKIFADYLSCIETENKPILFLPFPKEFLFDILFGRVKLYMCLDLEMYISLFPEFDLKAEWLSRKETMKVMEGKKDSGVIMSNNRCIRVSNNNGKNMILGWGTIAKIFFSNILPAYTAYSCHYYLESELQRDTNSNV